MRSQTKTYYPLTTLLLFVFTCLINNPKAISQTASSSVVSFTLVNADTDTDIGALMNGDTLVLNNLPTTRLNIRANTNPGTVDKVSFDFNGTTDFSTEGIAPYALHGDKSGDYNEWTPATGSHTVKGTARLNGNDGPGYTVNFYVVTGSVTDCNGDVNGSARIDDCGICAGGNTGITPNASKDACGVCFGDGSSCTSSGSGGNGTGSATICGNYPGGRIAMASDGNNADADDHGSTAFSIAMLHYAGLLDKLVFVGHSSLYKSSCKNAYGNWCDLMDSASTGAMKRFGGDPSIVYSFKEDYDDNNQLDQSIAAFTAAINASSQGDPLWIYCAGPMDVVYRAINDASPSKRAYVKCISHSSWNENSTYGGLSYKWADLKTSFAKDGVQFYEIKDQNNSNGNYDFAQENNGSSNWDWMTQSGNPLWTWVRNTNLDIWLQTNKNKAFDISDAGMMYWLISGGPQGGCDTCGPRQVENLFKNPCTTNTPVNACATNKAGTGSITSPSDNAVFAENSTIAVTTSIIDPDQNTSSVQLYVGNDLKSTKSHGNYNFSLNNLKTGHHLIHVKVIDSCGAIGYTDTVSIYVSGVDCAGVTDGSAYIDDCGVCVGGSTGLSPNSTCTDCAGVINGTASVDSCGVCAGGTTGITPGASCSSCVSNQVTSITLMSAGNGGPIRQLTDGDVINTNTVGSFSLRADICNNGQVGSVVFQLDGKNIQTENMAPYAINGDNSNGFKSWNPGDGTYVISAIPYSSGNASGSMGIPTTLTITISSSNTSTDCNGTPGGTASVDLCGVCSGGNTGIVPNSSCTDCNGVPNGTASMDSCGVCSGGTTGITPGSSCGSCVSDQVTSLTLMSAGNGGPIRQLSDGDIINTSIVGSFSLRADICNNGQVGSVVFKLNGKEIQTENIAPYAINGDNSDGFNAWNPGDGTYVISAIPYSSGNGGGSMGTPLTLTLTISSSSTSTDCNGVPGGTASIDLCGICSGGNTGIVPNSSCADCNGDPNGSASIDGCGVCSGGNTGISPNSSCGAQKSCGGNEIADLVLINASNSNDVGSLATGDTIDLAYLPYFSVRAEPSDPGKVQSVEFKLNGTVISTENVEPYAVNGDNHNGYHPWPLSTGAYTLEATPYSSNNAGGSTGTAQTTQFYVINSHSSGSRSASASSEANSSRLQSKAETSGNAGSLSNQLFDEVKALSVNAYPNPTSGVVTLEFTSGNRDIRCEVYDINGREVLNLQSLEERVSIDLSSFSKGLYLIKVYSGQQVHITKIMKD